MKILVVSHNVFSNTESMGKTLKSYFKGVSVEDIAQLYVHSEIPTTDCCTNYYRITDKEMIKSIFTRKSGRVLGEADIRKDVITSRTDTGNTAKLYQKARRRTPLIYMARNAWWDLGKWKTKKLLSWVDEFSPDIIFLASGDYSFIYKVATGIAKYKKIPLVVSCMDDYYFYNKNENKLLGRIVHRMFMKTVRKTMAYASCIYSICEKMSRDYSKLFNIKSYTLATPSTISAPLSEEKTNAISYIGNLGSNRHEQIVSLGRALKRAECDGKPQLIDVYSAESRPEILSLLTEENGIRFNGKISADQVLSVMGKSLAVIHTESFDEWARKRVAYSVSTKIADSLASGTCILAYGPGEIASINYLSENNAAYCITDPKDLESGLCELITNGELRKTIVSNALRLAKANHTSANNCSMLYETMKEICKKHKA